MSKFTTNRISEIETLTTTTIPEEIAKGISMTEYDELRITLNFTIIEALSGGVIKTNKDDTKHIRFMHRSANAAEIATISKLMDDFVRNVENPYLKEMLQNTDSMDIPVKERTITSTPTLEKYSNKCIHEYIFGSNDGNAAISKMLIGGMDVVEISAAVYNIKKTKLRNAIIIIGGITLIAVGAGLFVSNRKSKAVDAIDAPEVDVDVDVPAIDVDVIDTDMGIANADDAPVVAFDEE